MILLLYEEAYFNTNKHDSYVPNICISLLQEFEDVFTNEIPSGVPLVRGIKHYIDLVPGSTIPNRPAYKSNLEGNKLQRQVEELISKGYNQEGMNLCVVPVLLVPKKDGTWRICVDCRLINNIMVKYKHRILD
jgi:hypothetical protein